MASNLLSAQSQYHNQSMKPVRRPQNSWRSDVGVHPRCFHQDIIRPLSEESQHSMASSQLGPPMTDSHRSYQYSRPPPQPHQTSEKEKVKKIRGKKYSSNQQNSEPNLPPQGCIVLGAYNSLNENSTKANSNTESLIGDSHPLFKQQRKALRPPSINLAVTMSDSQSEQSEKFTSEYEMDEQCEESQVQFHLTNKQEMQESDDSFTSNNYPRGSEIQGLSGISQFQHQQSFRQEYEEEEEKEFESDMYSDEEDEIDIPEETDAGVEEVNSLYSEPPSSDKRMCFPVETEEREFRGNTEEAGELSNTKRFRQRQKSICLMRPPTYLRKPPRPLTSLGFSAHHHNSQILLPMQFRDISPVNYDSNHETHESAGLSRSQLDCLMNQGGVAQRPRSMASGASVPGHQSARKGNDSMIMTQQSHSEDWQAQEVKTERKNPQPLIFPQSANKAYHYPRPSTGTANFASIPSSRLQTCESVISREPLIVGEEHGRGEAIIRSISAKEQRDDGSVGDIDPISPRDLMMCNSSFSLELPRGETTFDQNKFKNQIRIFENSGCSLFFQNSTNCVSPSEGGISIPFPASVESEKEKLEQKSSRCAIFCASPSHLLNYNSTGGSSLVHPESTKVHSFHDRLFWADRVRKLEKELAFMKQEREKTEAELKAQVARQKVKINRLEDQIQAQNDQNAILRAEATTRNRKKIGQNLISMQAIESIVEEISRVREELRGMKQEVVENSQQVSEVWPHLQNVLTSALAQLP